MGRARETIEFDKRVGERVRGQRHALGMSQERLAQHIGITFQQLQKYEKGVNRIAVGRLHDICVALEVSMASMLEGLGPATAQPAIQSRVSDVITRTPEAIELFDLFSRVQNQKVRRRIVELVRAVCADA